MKKIFMLLLLTAFAVSMSVHRNRPNMYAENSDIYITGEDALRPTTNEYDVTSDFAEGFGKI